MRAMMAGICELVSHAPDADDAAKLGTTFSHLRELTRIMETEINEAVSSCTRARRQMIEGRSEEHTSELQSLMRISYAVFCLKKNKQKADIRYSKRRAEV